MSATLYVGQGVAMFGRVADVGDHYELVGADAYMFTPSRALKTEFEKLEKKLTPKDAYELLMTQHGNV